MNEDVHGNRKLFWKEVRKGGELLKNKRMEMGGWYTERMKCERSKRSILKICIM